MSGLKKRDVIICQKDKRVRKCVGAIIVDSHGRIVVGKLKNRRNKLPQGGIHYGETPMVALLREIEEEIGLTFSDFEITGELDKEFSYDIPKAFAYKGAERGIAAQSVHWFIIRLNDGVDLDIRNSGDYKEKGPLGSEFKALRRITIRELVVDKHNPRSGYYSKVFRYIERHEELCLPGFAKNKKPSKSANAVKSGVADAA